MVTNGSGAKMGKHRACTASSTQVQVVDRASITLLGRSKGDPSIGSKVGVRVPEYGGKSLTGIVKGVIDNLYEVSCSDLPAVKS